MSIIRNTNRTEDLTNQLISLALFCCLSCIILMLKFGGFKASLNLFGGKSTKKHNKDIQQSDVYLQGAYRTNRDEFFGYNNTNNTNDQPRNIPNNNVMRPAKSTNDLTRPKVVQNLRQSMPDVSRDPRGAEQVDARRNSTSNRKNNKIQEKEQKKLEKQRLAEQKARQKLEAQERAKQEKLRKEAEKREAQEAQKRNKKNDKRKGAAPAAPIPIPPPQPRANHAAAVPYSTNTLESSISRSSGPPPYSEMPKAESSKQNDKTNDVTFSKPIDTGSWDMISQHRQQISRPAHSNIQPGGSQSKQMVMDLNYNFGNSPTTSETKDNSDA